MVGESHRPAGHGTIREGFGGYPDRNPKRPVKEVTTTVLHRVFRRLLEGDTPWGSFAIQPGRYGMRYTLIVYPPGTTAGERRRIRIWRGWPFWGALLWFFSEISLSGYLDPWSALAVSTGMMLVSGATAFAIAGEPRARVRTMAATLLPPSCGPSSKAACIRIDGLADRLREAQAQRDSGLIAPAQFEMTWWQVYDDMSANAPTSARDSSSGAAQ